MKLQSGPKRKFLAVEVIQSSGMDCGPASLKCLLEGFGVRVSYGRLREACQTDVDGTSIDTLEDLAVQLGLDAEQVVIPADHVPLLEAEALPCIIVVTLPGGITHFVVAWRSHGGMVQIMDPGRGRRWASWEKFKQDIYIHQMPVVAAEWREWVATEDFMGSMRARLKHLGLQAEQIEQALGRALGDPSWRAIAAVDAITRMVEALIQAGGLKTGSEAANVFVSYLDSCLQQSEEAADLIPDPYWTVRPFDELDDEGAEQIMIRGAVLVRIGGKRSQSATDEMSGPKPSPALSPELAAALNEPAPRPWHTLWQMVRESGKLAPLAVAAAFVLTAGWLVFEVILFRSFLSIGQLVGPPDQRMAAIVALLVLVALSGVHEYFQMTGMMRLGRKLESRLRIAIYQKLPRLVDRYFHSRLTSDMAERAHRVHVLRNLPEVCGYFIEKIFMLLFTVAGIIWLDPSVAAIAILVGIASVVLPLLAIPVLSVRDLRLRTQAGSLTRFYMDALFGLVALRTHGAQDALSTEHEEQLSEWWNSGMRLLRSSLLVNGLISLLGFGFAGWLLHAHLTGGKGTGNVLLLVYWALNLPVVGAYIAGLARRVPGLRSTALRLLEPLDAPEEVSSGTEAPINAWGAADPRHSSRGVAVQFEKVVVRAGGHDILHGVDLEIPPGAQIGILGPSGAGKSTLVSLLLGWHRPHSGVIRIDGEVLDGDGIARLRQQTAWVDPAVQLWNKSLLRNIRYGAPADKPFSLGDAVEASHLRDLVELLPEGLQTMLGESGSMVSGGEGQRVRLARGMVRTDARLVILDEPFRGLDRDRRRQLLARVRWWWKDATVLCVSHDVASMADFDRVVVIEDGRITESGSPKTLAAQADSRYRRLLDAEEDITKNVWQKASWRRLYLDQGQLSQTQSESERRS